MDEVIQHLQEMEMRYTYQARQIEELSDELTTACRRLDELGKEVRLLRQMLGTLAPQLEASPDE